MKRKIITFIFCLCLVVIFSPAIYGNQGTNTGITGKITIEGVPMHNTEVMAGGQSCSLNVMGEFNLDLEPGEYELKVESLLPTEGRKVRVREGEKQEVNIDYSYEELGLDSIMKMDNYYVELESLSFDWKYTNLYNTIAYHNNKQNYIWRYINIPREIEYSFSEEIPEEVREIFKDFFAYIEEELEGTLRYKEIEWQSDYDKVNLALGKAEKYPDLAIFYYQEEMDEKFKEAIGRDWEHYDGVAWKYDTYEIILFDPSSIENDFPHEEYVPYLIRHEIGHSLGLFHPPRYNEEGSYVGSGETIMDIEVDGGSEFDEHTLDVLKLRYSTHWAHEIKHFKESDNERREE